ncbi:hypothetical protein DS901_06305 [Loktanella sp. D2R18]|uniref:hypothetical protein n=1 Tax=Rhodobacterales TaxID=204455 RepID=UPI000DEA3FC5|nr:MULTISPECIES: hypothetical protein [Rhodobacterales]MDO6591870.1 hypothetical protein [Yoonia sp. 1_MG-2023]RBW44833.1 hypothetical protein DS901_06305 [Loktanella sp. D2R18]
MFGFLIAAGLGFATPHIEPLIAPLLKGITAHIPIAETEKRLVAFMVAMLAAGIASAILYSGTAFWIVAGGSLGYFGVRIVAAIKKLIAERNAAE